MGTTPRELTGEEAALYDRQIRLWGLEAQRRLASSNVLLVGSIVSALGHELAKNVLLSGVARLGLCETGAEKSTSFLGDSIDKTFRSLKEMNPHVDVVKLEAPSVDLVGDFKVVCAIGLTRKDELEIAEACRSKAVHFMCGRACGIVGWVFFDLGDQYLFQEKQKTGEGLMQDKVCSYVPYKTSMDCNWGGERKSSEFGWHMASLLMQYEEENGKLPSAADTDKVLDMYKTLCANKKANCSNTDLVEDMCKSCEYVLPPVAAIVGGMWGREVVKVVSGRDTPLNNFFFYNVRSSVGSVERIAP